MLLLFNFFKHLPKYYIKSVFLKYFAKSASEEFERAKVRLDEWEQDVLIDTVNQEKISLLEKSYAVKTPTNSSMELRRGRIRTKLRERKTITKQALKSIIESFTNQEISIEEHFSDYSFSVNIDNIENKPLQFEEIYSAVEDVKPAHLMAMYNLSIQDSVPMYIGCKIIYQHDHNITIPAAEYNTYVDIKNMTYEDIKNIGYKETLYKKGVQ